MPALPPTFDELIEYGHTEESAREQMAINAAREAAAAMFRAFAAAMDAAIRAVRS